MAKKLADPATAGSGVAGALKFLKKKVPSAFRDESEVTAPQLQGVSTGSLAIDDLIGHGGFPRSKISEIFGAPSSGKSTLAAMACASAQAQGLYPVYVDVERGLDRVYAERIGFDVPAAIQGEKGLYVTPETFEDMLVVVETMVVEGRADLVIVDSVQALVAEAQWKSGITEIGQLGLQARLFSASLPKLTKIIDRPGHKTALVIVNQMRANIQTGWTPNPGAQPSAKPAGGWALAHYSSLRLELKQLKKDAKVVERPSWTDVEKMDKIPVASLHQAMTYKNKVSLPYQKREFYIRYDPERSMWGVDNLQTLLDVAVVKGIIEAKGGGRFLYNGAEEANVHGEQALYDWFLQRPEAVQELRTKLSL